MEQRRYIPLCERPGPVILDTDIGPDCDDVGALAVLISYAKEYGFPILGVCNCTSNNAGTGTIDAVARFCNYPIERIAQWDKPGFMDDASCHKYNTFVAEHFSDAYRTGTLTPENPASFYRSLLADAADHSVTVISIGMFNCLAALLASGPDAYSPLSGAELVRQKIYAMVSMAALLPRGRECNIICDYVAAKHVFDGWQAPIYLSHFNVGYTFRTGFDGICETPQMQKNPIYKSYEMYTAGVCNNSSFDLTAVQFAVMGEGALYRLDPPGRLEFYTEIPNLPDATVFVPDEAGTIYPMQKVADDQTLQAELNRRIRQFSVPEN